MATVNKDFRIKNGLVVEGTTATVNNSNILTENSTEFIQDTAAGLLTSGSHTGISFTYNDAGNAVNATVDANPSFTTSITFEGVTPDAFETVLQVTDPTQDRTITLPNATGTVALLSDIPSLAGYVTETSVQTLTNKTLTSPSVSGLYLSDGSITVEGTSDDAFETILSFTNPTDDRTITVKDGSGTLAFTSDIPSSTTGLTEGTNLYFTAERAQDAINDAVVAGTGISKSYDDNANTLTISNSGVTSLAGTANEVEVSAANGAITIGLPNDITIAGNITISGTPSAATHAVTKSYVDNISSGLNFHASTKMATTGALGTTANLVGGTITTTYNNGTSGLNATLTIATSTNWTDILIDGQSLVVADRVLIKNQSSALQNGIYTVTSVGALGNTTSFVFTRAADADNNPSGEVATGDFSFVQFGTTNGGFGFIMNTAGTITLGTSNINYTQFNGGQTVVAGNGLQEAIPGTLSINTAVTVDVSTAQTLTNKTLTSPTVSGLYLSDSSIIFEGSSADAFETTLIVTNPTADNTITFKDSTGTVAFVSDIPSSTTALTEGTNLYFTDERAQDAINTLFANGSHTNITATYNDVSNSLSLSTPGYTDEQAQDTVAAALTTNATHSGVSVSYVDASNALNITNTGVTSITGTSNQVTASSSTGGVTLSLPQNIATTSAPTFGSLTLTNALTASAVTLANTQIGDATATAGITATEVDSWSVASYSSAKYVVQLKKGTDVQVIELLVTVDGNNNVYLTEYADVISNASLGTTDADYLSGNVRLLVTAASAATTVKVHKTLIEA